MLLYFLLTGYFTKVFYNCSIELQAHSFTLEFAPVRQADFTLLIKVLKT